MVNSTLVSNKCKSTPTIALKTRKISKQDNKRTSDTSRTNDEISLAEKTNNVIKEVNTEVQNGVQNHEKTITELIQSKLHAIKERTDKIPANMGEFWKSLEFIQNQLNEEIEKPNTQIKSVENDHLDQEEFPSKLIELEDRSRRNNFVIDGVQEKSNEIWELCE